MREISLTQGQVALVADEDYEGLMQWKWRAHWSRGLWYAQRNSSKSEGLPRRVILMHRQIMGDPSNEVDHINGDGLDNQRSNLRYATHSQNQRNQHKSRGSSQYKGVSWRSDNSKWQAAIRVNNYLMYLGSFANEVDAARVYDRASLEHFGEYANFNFGEV